jgi:hypothetical protein
VTSAATVEALNNASPKGGKPAPVSLARMQVQTPVGGGVPGGPGGGVPGGVTLTGAQNVKLHPTTLKAYETFSAAGF